MFDLRIFANYIGVIEFNMHSQLDEVCKTVLFVGEGDFSFSANYMLKTRSNREKVISTCLNSGALSERQKINIGTIEQNGGLVYTDVDAVCLESHPEIKKYHFSNIVFNFPHILGKMNIQRNRQLVSQFLLSALKLLEDDGTICVTLCQGQGGTEMEKIKRKWCDSWQIASLAADASLILHKVKSFEAKDFEIYKCTGFRGLQKPFNTAGALTHVFKLGKPVEMCLEKIDYTDIVEKYHQDCENYYKLLSENLCHPLYKVLSTVSSMSAKIFQDYNQVTYGKLLTCRKSTLNSDTHLVSSFGYCEECINELYNLFFCKKKSGIVTAVSCCLCCLKNVSLEHPVHFIFSYFSDDEECLLSSLPLFLKQLSQVYTLDASAKKIACEDRIFLYNKRIVSSYIHDAQDTLKNEKLNLQNYFKVLNVQKVMDLNACYSECAGETLIFYSNVELFLLADNAHNKPDFSEGKKTVKIGTVLKFYGELENCICILLEVNTLASLKYHIRDSRTMYSDQSFYQVYEELGSVEEVFRTPSLYPPFYIHDTSFYIEHDFDENEFLMVIQNTVGCLVKSVTLIDSYYDKILQKQSRCYRFIYKSCDLVLTKEIANKIHTLVMRKSLKSLLNISLR